MFSLVNGEQVYQCIPYEYKHGGKIYKSYLYNNNKKICQHDIVVVVCEFCGKSFSCKFSNLKNNYICKSCKTKQTNLKKYGVENPGQLKFFQKKAKQTKLKKYGNENYNNNNQRKQTNLEKYGYDNLLKNRKILQEKMLEKYGVKHALQSKKIREKLIQTNLKKYGVENVSQIKGLIKNNKLTKSYNKFLLLENIQPLFTLEEYLQKQQKYDKFKWQCKICNTEFINYYENGIKPKCPTCYPKLNGYSLSEKEIVNYCKSFATQVIENSRQIIPPYEVDIYLPDYKLAIEYNGLYWHSMNNVQDKYYHQNKVKLANEKNIRLLHVWEHEWLEEKDLVKETINYYINNLNEEIKPEEPKLYNIYDNLIWI